MIDTHSKAYFPLTSEYVNLHAPQHPGVFALAVQRANGAYQPFYSAESGNLRDHLTNVLAHRPDLPDIITEHLRSYQWYFTFYVTERNTAAVEKLLAETNDPVVLLKIYSMT